MSERVEVPVSEAREGDWAVLKGKGWPDEVTARIYRGALGALFATGWVVRFPDGVTGGSVLRVLRGDVPALPTTPGTVIIATIRGEENVQAMLRDDNFWTVPHQSGDFYLRDEADIDRGSVRVVYEPETH